MKTFDTFEEVEGMLHCRKLPVVVRCKKINEPFNVNTLEGNYKNGKAGDYLIKGIDGELYICDGPIFERTYEILEDSEHSIYLDSEDFDAFMKACENPKKNQALIDLLNKPLMFETPKMVEDAIKNHQNMEGFHRGDG